MPVHKDAPKYIWTWLLIVNLMEFAAAFLIGGNFLWMSAVGTVVYCTTFIVLIEKFARDNERRR